MFAQVACQVCGKPFQVPKERLGETVQCSWCGKPTAAVPLVVEAQPLPPDAPPRRQRWPVFAAYAALLLLVAGGVFSGVRSLGGGTELREFVTPDGSCQALLPGSPREASLPADEFLKSGQRFVSEPSWGNKLRGEVGWYDVPDARLVRPEDLFEMLRDRRAGELNAKPGGEATVRVDSYQGREVRLTSGDAKYVERYLFDPKAARPRVYWVSVGGAKFDPESATAAKAMGSLRVR